MPLRGHCYDVVDRLKPDGEWNLLEDPTSGECWVLDFGKGLSSCLQILLGGRPAPLEPGYPDGIMSTIDMHVAQRMCTIICELADDEIAEVVHSTPPDWLDAERRKLIVPFLRERAAMLPQLMDWR